jgi:hypothetical protein
MKRAFLVGLNYQGTNNELYGCINDIYAVKQSLEKIGYKNFTIMTDEQKNEKTPFYPTRTNFLKQFQNFIIKSSPNETLFFYFSGHGSQLRDLNREERDGMDETICLRSDSNPRIISQVLDDNLRSIINLIKNNVKLRCILDCCHSGSAMDLPYRFISNRSIYQESSVLSKNVLMISGCEDKQYSSETVVNDTPRGALSAFILPLIEYGNKKARWIDLIYKIQDDMKAYGYSQIPQCSFTSINTLTSIIDL